jgi:hypothetical protein
MAKHYFSVAPKKNNNLRNYLQELATTTSFYQHTRTTQKYTNEIAT